MKATSRNYQNRISLTGKLAAVGSLIWSENFEGSGSGFPVNGIISISKDIVDKRFQRGDSINSNVVQVFKVPAHTRFAFTNDDIKGYTLTGIESSWLKDVYGIKSLTTQLKAHKPIGISDGNIDIYLTNY